MPTELFNIASKSRITKLALSNDWDSKIPWQHNGIDVPFVKHMVEHSQDDIRLDFWYIGPLAIVSGKLTK